MRIRAVPFCSLDVAVGVDPAGFDAWNEQEAILRDFSIGAPPDGFNPDGQNWGLVLELSARAPAVGLLRQLVASHLTKREALLLWVSDIQLNMLLRTGILFS